jgi:hypothetical protein
MLEHMAIEGPHLLRFLYIRVRKLILTHLLLSLNVRACRMLMQTCHAVCKGHLDEGQYQCMIMRRMT